LYELKALGLGLEEVFLQLVAGENSAGEASSEAPTATLSGPDTVFEEVGQHVD
jgi:hypothetical protein